MKSIALNQPYLFPYLGYFQLINLVDTFVIYDDVNFIKKGWIHRNNILTPQGPLLFTIPLKDVSQNKLIKDTQIHENFIKWKTKFLETLDHCYNHANNFNEGYGLINKILTKINSNQPITGLCFKAIKKILKYLEIKTKIIETSTIYHNTHLKGQDRIINICQQEKADQYINLIGGQELYDRQLFEKENINLKFHKISDHRYLQFDKKYSPISFVSNLSIIDILMWCKPPEIKRLLEKCEVI